MAKNGGKKKKAKRAERADEADSSGPKLKSKVAKAVVGAKSAAGKLSENPLVAEVVAAALVATAAALKDPKKARKLADNAQSGIEDAAKEGGRQTSALWQLALDVARRSIDALEQDGSPKSSKSARPRKKS